MLEKYINYKKIYRYVVALSYDSLFRRFIDQMLFCSPDRVFERDISTVYYDFYERKTVGIS